MTSTTPTPTTDAPPQPNRPVILPAMGVAKVKSVPSGDTVILLGKSTSPDQPAPEVLFTFEGLMSPRLASKSNPVDEPAAFTAREWLRTAVVGKQVKFETRKQGGVSGDRVYGILYGPVPPGGGGSGNPDVELTNLSVECVKLGYGTPKSIKYANPSSKDGVEGGVEGEEKDDYETQLVEAYHDAQKHHRGIHAVDPLPLVRSVKQAGDDFTTLALVEACQKLGPTFDQQRLTCVIEYVFDGSRFRVQLTDPNPLLNEFRYGNFTLQMAGVSCPRLGNTRSDPPTTSEPFAEQAREFVNVRLLHRELSISLVGTDKSGIVAVGTIHHPAGNIAVELLNRGLARMSEWSVRLLPPPQVPALRVAENTAKRGLLGVFQGYAPPVLQSASQLVGTVVEVISGDTFYLLPQGKLYDSEDVLVKVSLASVRAPRMGNERAGRPDELCALDCKQRLMGMLIGKQVQVQVHYERDIPLTAADSTEKRPFGTVYRDDKIPDVALLLIQEGLATPQHHRDEDEKSPNYDAFVAAEATAKAAKKGVHADAKTAKKKTATAIIDLTDPRKAKAHASSLIRAKTMQAKVDYIFHGALFKLYIPSENCYIRFAPNCIRCPQPTPLNKGGKAGEPFGDEGKRYARLNLLQRQVQIDCSTVTNGGIVVGTLKKGNVDHGLELLGAGLATVDPRKLEYGEAPQDYVDAMKTAEEAKMGLWSVAQPKAAAPVAAAAAVPKSKVAETTASIKLCEIRSGSHFFFHSANDEAARVMETSMKQFTSNHGTLGHPLSTTKNGTVVAALFDDGTGKSWYRAKIVEKKGPTKVTVLFLDHGNLSTVPVASHLRPLDESLGTDQIPPVATEASLALTVTRSLETDEGLEAARFLQSLAWGKELTAHLLAPDDKGKIAVVLQESNGGESINSKLISEGLALVAKPEAVQLLKSRMIDPSGVTQLALSLKQSQEAARRTRSGMWRYGDIPEDDDEGPI